MPRKELQCYIRSKMNDIKISDERWDSIFSNKEKPESQNLDSTTASIGGYKSDAVNADAPRYQTD